MLHRSTPSRHMSLVVVRLLLSTHSLSLSLPLRLVWFVGTFSGTAENELKIVLFRWRERENKRLLVTSDLILLFISFLPCSLSLSLSLPFSYITGRGTPVNTLYEVIVRIRQ